MRLILIRHAESTKNLEDRHGESNNGWPLTSNGLREAKLFGKILMEKVRLDALYSSDSEACLQTTSAINNGNQLRARIDGRLRSIDLGIISGLSAQEVNETFPAIALQLKTYHEGGLHPKNYKIPRAETTKEFESRIRHCLAEILQRNLSDVAIIAHRSTITMALNILLDWRVRVDERPYQIFELRPLAVSLVKIDGPSTDLLLAATFNVTVQHSIS